MKTLEGHADTILALAWRPGTNQIATASLDKLILVWDVEAGRSSARSRATPTS